MIICLGILLAGCQGKETIQHEDDPKNLVYYETEDEKHIRLGNDKDPMKKYLQSDEKGIGEGGTEQNIFKTDEALIVAQRLSKREEVRQAQVASSPTQIVVFVLLRDYQNPNIAKTLEEEIRMLSPHKDIYIYTDQRHYNRVEDLKSSMKARQIGNDLQRFFEEQFNIDIKD